MAILDIFSSAYILKAYLGTLIWRKTAASVPIPTQLPTQRKKSEVPLIDTCSLFGFALTSILDKSWVANYHCFDIFLISKVEDNDLN